MCLSDIIDCPLGVWLCQAMNSVVWRRSQARSHACGQAARHWRHVCQLFFTIIGWAARPKALLIYADSFLFEFYIEFHVEPFGMWQNDKKTRLKIHSFHRQSAMPLPISKVKKTWQHKVFSQTVNNNKHLHFLVAPSAVQRPAWRSTNRSHIPLPVPSSYKSANMLPKCLIWLKLAINLTAISAAPQGMQHFLNLPCFWQPFSSGFPQDFFDQVVWRKVQDNLDCNI